MTMSLSIPPHERAPGWGGRTPGSQTPGVSATLGLNVQMDGVRKMLQNCSKLPLNDATMPTPLLQTKMSTSSGDELNMGHFHCCNRLCMITGTFITVDELRHDIDQGTCCCTQRASQRPCPKSSTRCNSGSSAVFSTSAPENCRTCTNEVEHLINVLQLENLCGKRDHGNLHLRHDRDDDEQNCGISTVFTQTATKNLHDLQTGTSTTVEKRHWGNSVVRQDRGNLPLRHEGNVDDHVRQNLATITVHLVHTGQDTEHLGLTTGTGEQDENRPQDPSKPT